MKGQVYKEWHTCSRLKEHNSLTPAMSASQEYRAGGTEGEEQDQIIDGSERLEDGHAACSSRPRGVGRPSGARAAVFNFNI